VTALIAQQQSRIADLEAALRSALDLQAAFEAVVAREAAPLPPLPDALLSPERPPDPGDFTLAVLDISDVHVGERVTADETGGLNTYDLDECHRRAGVLVESALEALVRHRPHRLHIHLLGDIITGERIYRGQSWHLDASLLRQVFTAEELLLSMIVRLAEAVPNVRIYTVCGNHGRAGRVGEYHPQTNFDAFVYMLLARRLEQQPHIQMVVGDAPWLACEVVELDKQSHLLLHGDGIRSSLSIPYYGTDRASREWGRTLGKAPKFVHLGHFHRAAGIQLPGGEQLVNGSWVGATAFTLRQFREAVTPTQHLHIFDAGGLLCTYRLRLASPPALRANSLGVWEVAR
jgi:UDP-2,3-diacylglucosamine pyrophosphatase LpxH